MNKGVIFASANVVKKRFDCKNKFLERIEKNDSAYWEIQSEVNHFETTSKVIVFITLYKETTTKSLILAQDER